MAAMSEHEIFPVMLGFAHNMSRTPTTVFLVAEATYNRSGRGGYSCSLDTIAIPLEFYRVRVRATCRLDTIAMPTYLPSLYAVLIPLVRYESTAPQNSIPRWSAIKLPRNFQAWYNQYAHKMSRHRPLQNGAITLRFRRKSGS